MEIRMMEGSASLLQARLRVISAALEETGIAIKALEGTRNCQKGTEALAPVGAGSFIRVELADVQRVITGVGAGVCIEKNIESSIQDHKERQAELEKLSSSLQQQLSQLLTSIEGSKDSLARLIEQQERERSRPS
ncbi:MAG: prefoldin subunit alpha [Candidatus Bathyarchaeia archaeon]